MHVWCLCPSPLSIPCLFPCPSPVSSPSLPVPPLSLPQLNVNWKNVTKIHNLNRNAYQRSAKICATLTIRRIGNTRAGAISDKFVFWTQYVRWIFMCGSQHEQWESPMTHWCVNHGIFVPMVWTEHQSPCPRCCLASQSNESLIGSQMTAPPIIPFRYIGDGIVR